MTPESDFGMIEPLLKQYGISYDMLLFFGGALIAILLIILAFIIVSYVLGALGLYSLAKNKGYDNPWLAWIPFANSFLLAKTAFDNTNIGLGYLAFVVICAFAPIPYKSYITLVAAWVVAGFLFKRFSKSNVVLTVVNVITMGILSSFFIFAIRNNNEVE